jgi:hypothetical protein
MMLRPISLLLLGGDSWCRIGSSAAGQTVTKSEDSVVGTQGLRPAGLSQAASRPKQQSSRIDLQRKFIMVSFVDSGLIEKTVAV